MVEVCLIRHGKTYGNTLGRYIGSTDESLCREGIECLLDQTYPKVDLVYASPMKRCLESAAILYPGQQVHSEQMLRECDFGAFENKNYQELSDNPAYQAWVDSQGTLPFPQGEDAKEFRRRCQEGFRRVLEEALGQECQAPGALCQDSMERKCLRIGLVVHGGTIMSILEAFADPKEDFYHWQVKNGQGFEAALDEPLYRESGQIRLYEVRKLPE